MNTRRWAIAGVLAVMGCGGPEGEAPLLGVEGDVPAALALALMTNAAEESQLFVGTPPASLGEVLPLDGSLTAVGGVVREDGVTVIFEVRGSFEQTMNRFGDHLEDEGWEPLIEGYSLRGGFLPSNVPLRGLWCDETSWVRASTASFGEVDMFRVRYYEADGRDTPCEHAEFNRRMDLISLPLLTAHPEAEVTPGSGGGGPDEQDMDASIKTDLSAAELLEHYAKQLVEGGWEGGTTSASNRIALGRWSARDSEGDPVIGVLGVWPLTDSDSYRAWLRVERVR